MNYDRQWHVASPTNDVSFQSRDLGNHSDFGPGVDDLGRRSDDMSTWNEEFDAREIRVGESDRVGHSVSYSYQFYIALAIGGIISGVAVGWSLGLIPHQLSASNPATVEQKPLIAGMPTPNEKTIPTSNSRDPVPVVAFPEPEPNRSLAPVREPGPKTKSSKTRHDRGSSEISTATVQQRGKTLAVPVPETKPQTIEGWKIRDVVGSTVVLEGPGGVWRVTQGDTVPGVGKVDGIVRWGNRWIVSTSRGLISTQ